MYGIFPSYAKKLQFARFVEFKTLQIHLTTESV